MGSAFLQIVSGAKQGQVVSITAGHTLTIGRKRGELIIDDPLVSGRHCQITASKAGFILRDLNSTNGTVVNGRLIHEYALDSGAEITLGGCRMIFVLGDDSLESPVKSPSNDEKLDIAWLLDEELVELRGAGERTRTKADVIGQDLRLPPGIQAKVEVLAGQDSGASYRFNRGNITIGRRQGEVALNDVEVSRNHAVIEIFGREMIFLRDLGSTNGTYHNGRRVKVGRIADGDTIGCGKTVMKLTISY